MEKMQSITAFLICSFYKSGRMALLLSNVIKIILSRIFVSNPPHVFRNVLMVKKEANIITYPLLHFVMDNVKIDATVTFDYIIFFKHNNEVD